MRIFAEQMVSRKKGIISIFNKCFLAKCRIFKAKSWLNKFTLQSLRCRLLWEPWQASSLDRGRLCLAHGLLDLSLP